MVETGIFQKLHEKRYSVESFETGHPAYDRFLAGAVHWKGSLRELELAGWDNRSVLEREVPFLVRIEEESAESLGRAMLINAYCIPHFEFDWVGWPSQLSHMASFRRLFTEYTRKLTHARINADDAAALLTEIPKTLIRDKAELFEDLFFRSFSQNCPAPLIAALSDFLEGFFEADIFKYLDARPIIARHERLCDFIGRNPLELDFYRERKRVFELSRAQAAHFFAKLGPAHTRLAEADLDWTVRQSAAFRETFGAEFKGASRAERGQMIADSCRTYLKRATSTDVERWAHAGVPFSPSKLTMSQEDLISQLRLPMELTQEQACTVLEYMARHGDRFAGNYPALDYPLAAKLARVLPVGRADLERLVKDTDYQTDQSVKDLLIDALRGTKRGPLERLLRRFVPKLFKPVGQAELWADWIDAKRQELLAQAASRAHYGVSAEHATSVSDWDCIGGQFYDLDVVGYAKRIALAQSYGANTNPWLGDLRSLIATIGANLQALESMPAVSGEELPVETLPSLFGLWKSPTSEQLATCETKTLAVLEKLVARIELCERYPDLAPFEQRMRDQTRGQDFGSFHLTLFAYGIEAAVSVGVPEGLIKRLDSFDFSLIGGPYIEDTEPCFTEYEIEAWRSSIQALAALPEAIAGPKLEEVAQIVFAPELEPGRRDYSFAPRGYRQDMLGEAVIRTLIAMPWHNGIPTLMRLQERAQTPGLQKRLGEAVERIGCKKERLS